MHVEEPYLIAEKSDEHGLKMLKMLKMPSRVAHITGRYPIRKR